MMVNDRKAFKHNLARANGEDWSGSEPRKNLLLSGKRHVSKSSNNATTTAYVQILGTGMDAHDTLPSVLLFFDNLRFIFNAGEGLQRFCAEHKIKLSKIDHICLTRVCSETVGGLPGLLLTLAGTGEGLSVNIWGPSNLELLVKAMKSFIPNSAMVHTNIISENPVVDNKIVKIFAIPLQPSCAEGGHVKPSDISVIYICEMPKIMGKFKVEEAQRLGITDKSKYRQLINEISVKSDRLDIMVHPSDVMEPSIPGPVVLIVDCPTESHAQELLSIQTLSPYYDCSSDSPEIKKIVNCITHLTPLSVINSPTYEKWMQNFGSAQHIIAGHTTKHVGTTVLKSSTRVLTRLNYLCPRFFPTPAFCSPQNFKNSSHDSIASSEGLISKLGKIISAENLLKFTFRRPPNFGLDWSDVPKLMDPSDVIDELLSEIPEIVDAAQHVSQFWQGPVEMKVDETQMQDAKVATEEPLLDSNSVPSCLENIRKDDMEIVLLGTGSSQPSKYRNVSSIYVNLFSKGSLLLDCGEGTLAQLRRRYGEEGANDAVSNLRCIWISHIHADHHAGLARILSLRQDLLKGTPHQPILVIGPNQLKRFLDAYQSLEDLDMQFLDCRNTTAASWDTFESEVESNERKSFPERQENYEDMSGEDTNSIESTSFVREGCLQRCAKRQKLGVPRENGAAFPLLKNFKQILGEVGLERLISFPVIHCPESFGVVLKAAERINNAGRTIPGWKVVYSGDTRPCPELIEASCGATVLIHEATFEDGMVEEAIAKNHSTTKEAIEVGDTAAAYRIILTHFSQRYPKIPALDEISMQKTCIAFDLMSINLADLPILPNVLPYLKLLFKNEMIKLDDDCET